MSKSEIKDKVKVFSFSSRNSDFQNALKVLKDNSISVFVEDYLFKDYRGLTRGEIKVFIDKRDIIKFNSIYKNFGLEETQQYIFGSFKNLFLELLSTIKNFFKQSFLSK